MSAIGWLLSASVLFCVGVCIGSLLNVPTIDRLKNRNDILERLAGKGQTDARR